MLTIQGASPCVDPDDSRKPDAVNDLDALERGESEIFPAQQCYRHDIGIVIDAYNKAWREILSIRDKKWLEGIAPAEELTKILKRPRKASNEDLQKYCLELYKKLPLTIEIGNGNTSTALNIIKEVIAVRWTIYKNERRQVIMENVRRQKEQANQAVHSGGFDINNTKFSVMSGKRIFCTNFGFRV